MTDQSPHRRPGPVVVVGGANLDIKARSSAPPVHGTSNPGLTTTSAGGVGRNIAETLARLGTPVTLIAHLGHDAAGEHLLATTRGAGVDVGALVRGGFPTGTYTAVLDPEGELVIAVADMAGADALAPQDIDDRATTIAGASLVVVDGNLAPATVARVLDVASAARVGVVLEPVSVAKATRLVPVLQDRPVRVITPNRDELCALTGVDTSTTAGVEVAARRLHDVGVQLVWVRLGAHGSLLAMSDGDTHHFPAPGGPVVDVTGAGDAMLAAFVHALRLGHDPRDAVRHGHAAAALTLASDRTVREDLTPALLAAALDLNHDHHHHDPGSPS